MNSLSFHHKDNPVLEVKRDRQFTGLREPIFLYTNSDQIGSSMICMAKPMSSHSIIEFMSTYHYQSTKDHHETHMDQSLTTITKGAHEI